MHGACQHIIYGMHLAVALYHFVGGCRHMGLQLFSRRLYPYHVFVASIFGSCSVSYPSDANVPVVGVRNFSWRDSCSVICTFTFPSFTKYRLPQPSSRQTGCVSEAGSSCCSPICCFFSPVILMKSFPGRKTCWKSVVSVG